MLDVEQQQYAKLGSEYFWFAGKRHLAWSLLNRYLDGGDRLNILDVGCGPGYSFSELKQWGSIVGIDTSQEALGVCRNRNGHEASLICGSAEALPCRDQTFSLVVALDVFEHLEDDVAGLRECQRVLRVGGWLLVSVPAFPWLWGDHDDLYRHKRRYRVTELQAKLESAGFERVKITYCKSFFVGLLWMFRRLKQLSFASRRDDFLQPPAWLNRWLTWLITSEAPLIHRWNLPWGAEIIGIARKPCEFSSLPSRTSPESFQDNP